MQEASAVSRTGGAGCGTPGSWWLGGWLWHAEQLENVVMSELAGGVWRMSYSAELSQVGGIESGWLGTAASCSDVVFGQMNSMVT